MSKAKRNAQRVKRRIWCVELFLKHRGLELSETDIDVLARDARREL